MDRPAEAQEGRVRGEVSWSPLNLELGSEIAYNAYKWNYLCVVSQQVHLLFSSKVISPYVALTISTISRSWVQINVSCYTSARIALYSHPLHYSKTFIGYLLNGVYTLQNGHLDMALHTGQPPYLAELLWLHKPVPVRTLQSSSSLLLCVSRCNLEFGSRTFRISAPKIWNSLPANIRDSPSLPTFRRHLKTHYFQLAYLSPWWPHPSPVRPDSLETIASY